MFQQENYERLFRPELLEYLQKVPYDVCRDRLYSTPDLMTGYDPDHPESLEKSFDRLVYRHFIKAGDISRNPMEAWAQGCHDTAVSVALNKMLAQYDPLRVVGIMGGHQLARSDLFFRKIVQISKRITEMGWLVSSGGGPGAMEAVHLGAFLAGRSDAEVEEALSILQCANYYDDPLWLESAWQVYTKFPQRSKFRSLAIPTWVYAHEPHNVFASDTAKFFSNSIREDVLISTAFGGILFLPGSAGTFREIFQDLVQNHYLMWEYPSPMIFVGKEYWAKTAPLFSVLQKMLEKHQLRNLLTYLIDDVDCIVDIISDFQNLHSLIRAKQQGKPQRWHSMFSSEESSGE